MSDLGQMLDTIAGLDGVQAAVVAGRDGLLIEGRPHDDDKSLEALGAMGASLLEMVESMATELERGEVKQTIVEFATGMALIQEVSGAVLIVLIGSSMNLGRVRLALRKHQATVHQALAAL